MPSSARGFWRYCPTRRIDCSEAMSSGDVVSPAPAVNQGAMSMKVILKEDIKQLGLIGEVVNVADGYGRNFLIPQGKALEANAGNMRQFENFRRQLEQKRAEAKSSAEELARKIEQISCTIVVQAHEEQLYGAVTNADVAAALQQEGVAIDKKDVLLEEPIKQLGVYQVTVRLHPDVKPQVKVWVVKS
ncbi:MAG: 50S ribosomal protein L9 [Candidatus Omnitrophica bacterium]|nr:50S ribosomal protein L9 [Candidatus Omnitrophota bacterium]